MTVQNKMLAVLFPGMGYTCHKPLLYYAGKLVTEAGYEKIELKLHDMPDKAMGDEAKMYEAYRIASAQTEEQLRNIDFDDYERILFVGKSIGTILAVDFAVSKQIAADLLLYTPLEQTFGHLRMAEEQGTRPAGRVLTFHGTADPWVADTEELQRKCCEAGCDMIVLPDTNHSLETADVQENLANMALIMRETAKFIKKM